METYIIIINKIQTVDVDNFEDASRIAANECVKGHDITIQHYVNDELISILDF